MKRLLLAVLTLSGLCVLYGCGGGESGSSTPPPPATHFSVSPAPATATAGTAFNVSVTALDASNNVVSSYAGTARVTSSDARAVFSPASSTLTSGTGTFSATLKTAGEQTITATDTVNASISGISSSINVSPGAATSLSLSAPATATAGTAFNFTVTALDVSNNVATSYSGTVHFTSSDVKADLPPDQLMTSGIATTFPAVLKTPGPQEITVTDTVKAITGTSSSINVSPAAAANPVPLINQPLVPDAVAPGGAAFTLLVNGAGFVSGSVVKWNGTARTTTFVDSSQLKASIPSADITAAGTASVTVVNPAPGGGNSNVIFFEHAPPSASVSFLSLDATAGGAPSAAAAADFNGDGKLDLAVTNFNDNTLSILLGAGDGTFSPPVNYATGTHPFSVAAGDFNGDGKLDLVVANVGGTTVSVFIGNGDGTFKPAVSYEAGNAARSVVVGDFNRDGKLDLAVANQTCGTPSCGPGLISILLGNGDGTFQTHLDYLAADGPTWMTVGDFNQDGNLDLAVTGGGGGAGNQLSVLLGNGDGTFQNAVNYTTDINPAGVAAADLNKDGKLDLAVVNNIGSLSILLGNGDGTFQNAVNYAAGSFPIGSLGVGDLNGDGNLDLAIANGGGNNLSIYLGNGDGTFQPQIQVNVTAEPFGVVLGDFNQDGRLDLAAPNQGGTTVTVLLQAATVTLSSASLDLGSVLVGTSGAPQAVTFMNDGPGSVNINSIAIAGTNATDFGQTNNCSSSLAAGSSCTIDVTLTPSQEGPRTASLTITDNGAGSPQSVSLSGVGLVMGANATLATTSLTFATQLVATTSAAQAVSLTNYGTAALNITSITSRSNFGQTNNCPLSLASAASCTINVTFTPTASGTLVGTISVADNAPASPQTVSLTGVGTFVELNPGSLNFGSIRVNASKTLPTTLTNTGSTTLTITSIAITGAAYTQTNTCGTSVAAAASCTITVTFHPTSRGTQIGDVVITDSDPASPQTVALSGTGIVPPPCIPQGGACFGPGPPRCCAAPFPHHSYCSNPTGWGTCLED